MGATVAQPPELAGGAGFTFEDAVAGSYLTALLQQGYAPDVESRVVTRIALQQRDSVDFLCLPAKEISVSKFPSIHPWQLWFQNTSKR
jgi:hypothetical protein